MRSRPARPSRPYKQDMPRLLRGLGFSAEKARFLDSHIVVDPARWSGGDRDCFPRDVIPNWRRNPPGADSGALIPGETLVGHGPFRFRLRAWDGHVER